MINIHYMRASETGDAGRYGNGISQEKYSTRTSDKENGLRKDGEKYQIKNIDNK